MPTYILIHGGGGSGWDWHLVAPELVERGHEVIAPDLPSKDENWLTSAPVATSRISTVSPRRREGGRPQGNAPLSAYHDYAPGMRISASCPPSRLYVKSGWPSPLLSSPGALSTQRV